MTSTINLRSRSYVNLDPRKSFGAVARLPVTFGPENWPLVCGVILHPDGQLDRDVWLTDNIAEALELAERVIW